MRNHNYNERRYYTEAEKETDDYLMSHIDNAIAELVTEKRYLKTAYNYYNGKMDAEEFKYLEDNYGIGNPTSIEFIPLIRKHIDALVGEHLGNKLKPKITCKDKSTLDEIEKMKAKELKALELNTLKKQFQDNLNFLIEQKGNPGAQVPQDKATDSELNKTLDQAAQNFISEFEKSAQFILEDIKTNKNMDLIEKRRMLMLDLLITGECGYKVEIVHEGQTPVVNVLDIKNLFRERNRNSPYLKNSPRVVYRKWMTRDQVLNRYGHLFEEPKIAFEKLFSSNTNYGYYGSNENVQYISAPDQIGLIAGYGFSVEENQSSDYNDDDRRWNLIPVYEVEWITTNKETIDGETIYKQYRYKGTRIGEEIYAEMGRDDTAIRSNDSPYECALSFNGISYTDGHGKPYSLVLATKNIQDKYNILHFHRDTLIANSGVKGSHVDVANLPSFLGESPEERFLAHIGYKKQGHNIIDSSQETASQNNTIFAGFDETVPGQAIQAIQFAIDATEAVASSITGVFRERLGNIEQKDAVSNVEVGIKTSAVVTKQYFHVMDNITTELLIDLINACKVTYAKGKIGSILLGGHKQKIFTITPKYFCFTDYDIHIGDSSDITREIQEIKAISMELIKGGLADVDIVIDAITTESLTDMRDKVKASVAKKAETANSESQLQQQLMQMQQQLQQMQQEAQKLQTENEALKQKDRDLEVKKVDMEFNVKNKVADNTDRFNNQKIELDQKRVELEKMQLTDKNPNNDEVQNS